MCQTWTGGSADLDFRWIGGLQVERLWGGATFRVFSTYLRRRSRTTSSKKTRWPLRFDFTGVVVGAMRYTAGLSLDG